MAKKLRDVYNDCTKCKKSYQLTDDTAVLHWYKKRMYLCHLEMACPHCKHTEMIFLPQDERERFFAYDWPREVSEDGPDWLVEEWEAQHYKLLKSDPELIPRHEGEVRDLAILLDVTPMEWLMEIFSWPLKPTLPPRWR